MRPSAPAVHVTLPGLLLETNGARGIPFMTLTGVCASAESRREADSMSVTPTENRKRYLFLHFYSCPQLYWQLYKHFLAREAINYIYNNICLKITCFIHSLYMNVFNCNISQLVPIQYKETI